MTELDTSELLSLMHKLHACYQRHILLEGGIDGIAHIQIILGGNDGILGQQRQERLLGSLVGLQFGHYLYPVTGIERELILNLEGAHALHVVAKKVDTIRVLATVAIHVEDRTTQRKLSGLVHVVHLVKAQLAQLLGDIAYGHLLPFLYHHRTVVQRLLRHHHLGQGLRIGNNEHRFIHLCHHLGTENLRSRIKLSVLDGTTVTAWEEQHPSGAQQLRQVVIKVARLLGILQYKQNGLITLGSQRTKQHGCTRGQQPLKENTSCSRIFYLMSQRCHLRQLGIYLF